MRCLPRTPAGKSDEQHLSLVGRVATRKDRFQPPSTPIQHALVEIWKSVLPGDAIGVLDDFFAIGGHSIRAVQMLLLVTQQLEVEVVDSGCPARRREFDKLRQVRAIRPHGVLAEAALRREIHGERVDCAMQVHPTIVAHDAALAAPCWGVSRA